MRFHQAFVFPLALAGSVFAQDFKPVAYRLAAQNALFEEQYESDPPHMVREIGTDLA